MADDLEAVKNSLDVLSEVFQVASDVSEILTIASGPLAPVFSIVGAILGLIGALLPESDLKYKEIIRRFDQLDNKIDRLRSDMEDLKNVIRLDIAELEYSKDLEYIELGMQYCLEIGKRSGEDERMWYQTKLKNLCANENCALALTDILDGMTGNGIFRSGSILDKFYDMTGGNRPRISALGTRLVQVLSGGMMVISTYETMMLGKKGAADVTKPYYRRLTEASDKVKSVLNRCMQNFRVNMLIDLNKKLDKGGSNLDLATNISALMRDKYDWLEHYCLVYDNLRGFDKHTFGGNQVSSLHRNGKCGIVFFRTKGKAPKFSNRYDEAYKIVDDVYCKKAKDWYNKIVAKTRERGIQWTGCAVINAYINIATVSNFSTKILLVDKYAQFVPGYAILLLN